MYPWTLIITGGVCFAIAVVCTVAAERSRLGKRAGKTPFLFLYGTFVAVLAAAMVYFFSMHQLNALALAMPLAVLGFMGLARIMD